jgi:polar amino acid transport system substrate-binding protein
LSIGIHIRRVGIACAGVSALQRNAGLGAPVVPKPLFTATTDAGPRREPEKTWRDFVDTWIDWHRGLERMRDMLIDSLSRVSNTEADIPPRVSF